MEVAMLRFLVLTGFAIALTQDPVTDYANPGAHKVASVSLEWKDVKRDNREVPVKIYYPVGSGPYPVIVFSHGLGGSRDGYEYLGKHWASHGYVVVHVQHRGSDDAVWKGSNQPLTSLKNAAADPINGVNRALDVPFVLDQLASLNKDDGRFGGKLDLEHVGMAGHSFGAWTTLAVIGRVFPGKDGKGITATEPRIKAAVAMSPNANPGKDLDKEFGGIKVPCLHLTGTKDASPIDPAVKPEDRTLPFKHVTKADQALIVFKDGDHMVFSGRAAAAAQPNDAAIQAQVLRCSTTWWAAYLKGDAAAKAYLRDGMLKKTLGDEGTYEFRAAK
jgi:predicted dienelactone hydrolase